MKVEIPIIDVEKYLNKNNDYNSECKKVADCLHEYGILIFKDPRVDPKFN